MSSIHSGRQRVLGVHTELDRVLSAVAPIGMAIAAGGGLVVDLEPGGIPYPAERTLDDLVTEGPRRSELTPERSGVAVLRNDALPLAEALSIVDELARHWPAVVLRSHLPELSLPVVPVIPLYPGWLAPRQGRSAVWQALTGRPQAPGPGPVLPPIGRMALLRMLSGHLPRRSRWIRSWRPVWEAPWQ